MRKTVAKVFTILLMTSLFGLYAESKKAYTFTKPYTYKNISIFLIEGKETKPDMKYTILSEAMKKKLIVVKETGTVSQLTVENVSKTETLFIQAGDIVKGGKQDRVLTVDMVLPPNSGPQPIASFCVEQSRWAKRGKESVSSFSQSDNNLVSKELRNGALNQGSSQSKVWKYVEKQQGKYNKNLKTDVKKNESASSLQLALENKDLKKELANYKVNLNDILDKHPNAIGFAYCVNGQFSRADVYMNRKLFSDLWPKLLNSSIMEAIGDFDEKKKEIKLDKTWQEKVLVKRKHNKQFNKKLNNGVTWTNNDYDQYFSNRSYNEKEDYLVHESWDIKVEIPKEVELQNNDLNGIDLNGIDIQQIENLIEQNEENQEKQNNKKIELPQSNENNKK